MTLPSLEMVLQLLTGPAILNSGAPLGARMVALCKHTTELLECDRSSIFVWDGASYRATYNYGNPSEIERHFYDFRITADQDIVKVAEANASYVVVNDAKNDPRVARMAEAANVTSVVMAALVETDGSRLGLMTAEFNETMGAFEPLDALVTRGAAHLAHTALVQDRERSRRLQLSRAVLEVEEEAWRRVGRDLHDDALQRSFAISVKLEKLMREIDDPMTHAELTEILTDTRAASSVLRYVTTHVHPESFQAAGLVAAIRRQLQFMSDQSGSQVTFSDERDGDKPNKNSSNDVDHALGRIVQQALHNVSRHARAEHVSVALRTVSNGTSVSITDDGDGFDTGAARPGRLGLVSMRERATLLDGTLHIESALGQGTTVHAWIPHPITTDEQSPIVVG